MEPIIELREVSKSFKSRTVLRDVNLRVLKGQTIGIVGPNGSGKSLLFKIIAGFIRPDSGEIYIRNKRIGKDIDFPERTGILIDKPGYIGIYSGFKNLKYLAGIQNLIDDERIKDTMKRVGLNPDDRTRVQHYSMGMKQKLGIAQAIMEDQDLVILDEPFNALDYKSNHVIKDLIKELRREGRTILLTSHRHSDLEELCHDLYLIQDGTLEKWNDELKNKYFQLTQHTVSQ